MIAVAGAVTKHVTKHFAFEGAKKMKKHHAWMLIGGGAALGFADMYSSGAGAQYGLPASSTPSTTNTFTTINNLLPIPTSFVLIGLGVYLLLKH